MKMQKIPNICFTYWSGDSLTWLHILTLRTLMAFNPNKRVILYTTNAASVTSDISFSTHEHKIPLKQRLGFETLKQIENLEIISLDLEHEFGLTSHIFHTYVADLVRIKKLEEHGGLWFDMDVLFLNEVPEEYESLPSGKECFTMMYSGAFATGFMGGFAHAEVFQDVLSEALTIISLPKNKFKSQYQALGPDLWKRLATPSRTTHPTLALFDRQTVYPYLWNEMTHYFETDAQSRCNAQTLGVHWYNGSSAAHIFLNKYESALEVLEQKSPIAQDLRMLQTKGICLDI